MKILKPWIALIALSVIILSTVQAQTNGAATWKQRVANRIASEERPQLAAPTAVDNVKTERPEEATENTAPAQNESLQSESFQERLRDFRAQQMNALAGTWDLTLTFSDGSQVKSTLNVALGRRDGEGSVLHAAEASLLLPNPTTPEQGVWEHLGGLRFIASYKGFAVDEKFEKPAGKIGFRHSIRLHPDGESFTGRAVFEVVDPEGNVVFTDTIKTEGKRQHAEAP